MRQEQKVLSISLRQHIWFRKVHNVRIGFVARCVGAVVGVRRGVDGVHQRQVELLVVRGERLTAVVHHKFGECLVNEVRVGKTVASRTVVDDTVDNVRLARIRQIFSPANSGYVICFRSSKIP